MIVELPHIDVMCLTACNLKCVGCSNGMGMVAMEVWPAAQVEHDIERAASVMHAEVACLLGGEPTAHPELVELMRFTASSGLADRVQVLTNGMRLHRMADEFWSELDWLKISVYPGATPQVNIDLARQHQREHGFDLTFYDVAADPFRAVLTDTERTAESAQRVYDGCWYRTFTRKLERGYFYRCCTSPSISQEILGLGPDADGIALDGLTAEALQTFLDRREPAHACSRCHGHLGPRLEEWSEVRGREQWLKHSMVPALQ